MIPGYVSRSQTILKVGINDGDEMKTLIYEEYVEAFRPIIRLKRLKSLEL